MKKIIINKETYLITYKILHDCLLLAIATFSAMLIGEGLLPGFVSSRISFSNVAIVMTLIIITIAWLGAKLNITYTPPKLKSNKLLPFLVLSAFLLIGNSMLRFELWSNIIITLSFLFIFFLIYQLLVVEN